MTPMIANFGSINIDHVYRVPHFVAPGETLSANDYHKGLGGKGLNQSVALHRAGARVLHVGCIGADDAWMRAQLTQLQLDTAAIEPREHATGHAMIQVNDAAENCIVLCAGANHALSAAQINTVLANPDVHWVLLQNETNAVGEIITAAHAAGKRIAFNPAPCHAALAQLPLELIDTLVVNEVEAAQLTGCDDLTQALATLRTRVRNVVLTLGAQGVRYVGEAGEYVQAAQPVQAVDTTAAGDTFIGYYLAGLMAELSVPEALAQAGRAAAITVTRVGASESIPYVSELI